MSRVLSVLVLLVFAGCAEPTPKTGHQDLVEPESGLDVPPPVDDNFTIDRWGFLSFAANENGSMVEFELVVPEGAKHDVISPGDGFYGITLDILLFATDTTAIRVVELSEGTLPPLQFSETCTSEGCSAPEVGPLGFSYYLHEDNGEPRFSEGDSIPITIGVNSRISQEVGFGFRFSERDVREAPSEEHFYEGAQVIPIRISPTTTGDGFDHQYVQIDPCRLGLNCTEKRSEGFSVSRSNDLLANGTQIRDVSIQLELPSRPAGQLNASYYAFKPTQFSFDGTFLGSPTTGQGIMMLDSVQGDAIEAEGEGGPSSLELVYSESYAQFTAELRLDVWARSL